MFMKFLKLFTFTNFILPEDGGGSGNSTPNSDGQSSGNNDQKDKSDDSGNPPDDGKGNADNQDGPGGSIDKLPKEAQDEIKRLRKENAKYRTQAKTFEDRLGKLEGGLKKSLGLEDDDKLTAEQKLEALELQNQQVEFNNAILTLASEHGISGADNVEYLSFLINKQVDALDENEELGEEVLATIIQKVKGMGKGSANSSVDGGKGGNPPPGGNSNVTLEDFQKMNILERSKLFRDDKNTYLMLQKQAKEKGVLI